MKIPEWLKIAKTPEEHQIILYVLIIIILVWQLAEYI